MTLRTGGSEVWKARIGHELATQLRADGQTLGVRGRSEIVKIALQRLHRQVAEERMARSVDDFYGDGPRPLPTAWLAKTVGRGQRRPSRQGDEGPCDGISFCAAA